MTENRSGAENSGRLMLEEIKNHVQQLAAQIVQEGPAQTGRGQRMNWKPKTGPRPAFPAPDERRNSNMNPQSPPTIA